MKSRHRKNKSLVNDFARSNPYGHHRSFSYNRYPNPQTLKAYPLTPHLPVPDLFVSDSITLPLSTDYNRQPRTARKTSSKEGSQQLPKQKRSIKSKERGLNPRKPKDKSHSNRDKNSKERQDRLVRGSKQFIRNKHSQERSAAECSGERRTAKNSQDKKAQNGQKGKTDKIKNKTGPKRKQGLEEGANWEQILRKYAGRLTLQEEAEIREYKWVYFLGKIRQRKQREPQVMSAREYRKEEQEQCYEGLQCERWQQSDEFYRYELGDHIAYRYEILDSINKGSFGEVLRVHDHKSGEKMALKVVKKSPEIVQQTYVEVAILTHIKERDRQDLAGIVRIKDFTIFRSHICIVFELLEGNLYELLEFQNYKGLSEQVIRIFAVQILSALKFLQEERIIHCDIKPQNIVMCSWGKSRVKLIDFGSSCFAGQQIFQYLQSRYYRAPEVMLRRTYSYPIDMWSFACLLLELRTGQPIFAGANNVEQLLYIVNAIGMPIASHGEHSKAFLTSQQFLQITAQNYLQKYRYMEEAGIDPQSNPFFAECKYHRNCMRGLRQRIDPHSKSNDDSFLNFIQRILVWEPDKRLKPNEALQDPWILKGLPQEMKDYYTILNSSEQLKKKSKGKKQVIEKSKSKGKRSNKSERAPGNQKRKESGGLAGELHLRSGNQARVHFNHKAQPK